MANRTARAFLWLVCAALCAAVAALVLFRTMRGAGTRSAEDEIRTRVDRLQRERIDINRALAEAKAELDAARAKGEDSEEFRAAEAKMAAAVESFRRNRTDVQLALSERNRGKAENGKQGQQLSKQRGE